jgi:hypothetical protein
VGYFYSAKVSGEEKKLERGKAKKLHVISLEISSLNAIYI